MERIKQFFIESWKSKLVSLLIAISIWYLIKNNLESGRREPPVPGTAPAAAPPRGPTSPVLEETLLSPLLPAPAPVPIPVPGGEAKGG